MANVERGVVKAPNQSTPGNRVAHSKGISSQAPGTHAANDQRSAPIGSSASMGRTHPGLTPPNEVAKFDIADARLGWEAPVAAPGHGSVPVNPFMGHNDGIVPAHILRDSAKK